MSIPPSPSFTGTLPDASTPRWNLSPSRNPEPVRSVQRSYLPAHGVTLEGVKARYSWGLDATCPGWEDLTLPVLRVACHLLVDQVRSEGVPELLRTVLELRDTDERLVHQSTLPEPTVRDVSGRVVEHRVAPPFKIEME